MAQSAYGEMFGIQYAAYILDFEQEFLFVSYT